MIGLFDGGGLRRLTRAWLRHQLEAVTNDRDRLAADMDRAIARAEDAEQRALTAEAEYRRIAGRPTGPDAETTVTIPALRDVQAAMGDGDYLNDTDDAWRARHTAAPAGPVVRITTADYRNPATNPAA